MANILFNKNFLAKNDIDYLDSLVAWNPKKTSKKAYSLWSWDSIWPRKERGLCIRKFDFV